jgi:tRNA modification GTPase
VDTAGLRDTQDVVERLGVERSLEAARKADAIVYMVDAPHLVHSQPQAPSLALEEKDSRILSKLPVGVPVLKVLNKVDALSNEHRQSFAEALPEWRAISVKACIGLQGVLQWLEERIHQGLGNETQRDAALYLNERQLACLHAMQAHVAQAVETLGEAAFPLDMVTIPLTDALRELDSLLGEDTTELVLDDVFSRFCVGK